MLSETFPLGIQECSPPPPRPDLFQYTITVETSPGSQTLTTPGRADRSAAGAYAYDFRPGSFSGQL
ncbi:MAG: hypothetical protein IPK19_24155 [Chloroflexi bacterium]|nr:hypothetical protein [Chloroflexota bacterium]